MNYFQALNIRQNEYREIMNYYDNCNDIYQIQYLSRVLIMLKYEIKELLMITEGETRKR